MNFFTSPLEQFQIVPIIPLYFGTFDISFTNGAISLAFCFFLSLFFFLGLSKSKNGSYVLWLNHWQLSVELIYEAIISLVADNINGNKSQYFFPLVFSIFFFLLTINLIGLIPYGFTVTSQFVVTLCLSSSIFLGLNILCVRWHGLKIFSLFLPAGTSTALAFLLVPIEIISYLFKPLSLAIRLFINMMAGHTLLKVLLGFTFILMGQKGLLFIFHFFPVVILFFLLGLELAVVFIQSFVFSIILCLCINDAINLH